MSETVTFYGNNCIFLYKECTGHLVDANGVFGTDTSLLMSVW